MSKKKSSLRIIFLLVLFIGLIGGWFAYEKYSEFMLPNVPEELADSFVEIPTGASFGDVKDLLKSQGLIMNSVSFETVAKRLKYIKSPMRAGRFEVIPGWSNLTLVRHLRNGQQSTVNVVLNNERLLEDVAGKVSGFIEADSLEILQSFSNEGLLAEYGLNMETMMSIFIPNTYEFFWNTDAHGFLERMKKEHDLFWSNQNRISKAEALEMSTSEVYTLASIVERETLKNDEKKRMAGVYLNRIRIGMPLQADPTLVFATRDFGAKRVLDYHKNYKSPYNTYQNVGLPPGPISMASITSLDAVLNHEKHKYLYFCAKPDGSGYHAFAKTLSQHNQNAIKYRRSLNFR